MHPFAHQTSPPHRSGATVAARRARAALALVASLTLLSCAAPPESVEPDTGTWIGYPVGAPPTPNPALKRAIIDRAEQEWRFFGRQEILFKGAVESIPLVGDWEDDGPRQSNRVNDYWRAVGEDELDGMDCRQPWSAAFTSWVMHHAGVPAHQFKPSSSHWTYMTEAIKSASRPGRYFVPRRLQDYSPEPGDLICAYRGPSRVVMVDGYVRPSSLIGIKSHCDLVTAKQGRTLEVIGGNVRNSVSKVRLELDRRGRLQPMPRRPWFLILQNRL